ncbi:HTH-type transcriptional regulator LeuO [Methylobacterium crusticola]|uniref:HTH-type transcriptional regulator LeuO n=2 Tax=Methylobacterium crusticola TaxID=1697972 RepID=A0ABQ4R5S4_9HYPH|nr:LysR substrate-binding domain-containing protein [Methylobacterium crusticola]GJD53052.1 HTH-type transcriptional regulator LeuO [Methylobacterium crusticola]
MTRSAGTRASILNRLDLNLLRLFDAVMRERHVARAGQSLGLSQSAVSHGLRRLRTLIGDDLFVRTAQAMEPTPRALAMAVQVRDALTAIEGAIGPQCFDPSSSTRQFRLAATDHITAVVAPALMRTFETEAPHASILIRPATRIDLTMQVDLGQIDIAVGIFSQIPHRLQARTLFEDRDLLVTAPDHPEAGGATDIRTLARDPLMVVTVGGSEDGLPDGRLSERGLTRQTEMFDRDALNRAFRAAGLVPRLSVLQPHFLAVPSLLANSRRVAIVPASLAHGFEAAGVARVSAPPWEPRPMTVQMVWHERWRQDPAHTWLREALFHASRGVAEAVGQARHPALTRSSVR